MIDSESRARESEQVFAVHSPEGGSTQRSEREAELPTTTTRMFAVGITS
jgi:hypothetical protein